MKHYTESKWNELDAIDLWGRNRSRAENIRAAKASYRRRERRVLARMVEDLVIEELGNDSDYWDAELEAAIAEHGRVVDEYTEAERCFERYGDEVDWDYYESRFTELRKRVNDAYRELYAIG